MFPVKEIVGGIWDGGVGRASLVHIGVIEGFF
jgi:hypothetical protein